MYTDYYTSIHTYGGCVHLQSESLFPPAAQRPSPPFNQVMPWSST